MITANDLFLKKYDFTPPGQESDPTVFKLRAISEDERTEIIYMHSDPAKAVNYAILKCVVGWSNFKNADGKEIEFSERNTKMIPFETRGQIFDEVLNRAKLSDQEIKN